jgi:hypothetical protein
MATSPLVREQPALPGRRVARQPIGPISRRGRPDIIVSDHGTKFTQNGGTTSIASLRLN